MPANSQQKQFIESSWNDKEFDWTGKSFYFVNFTSLLGNPIGLGGKMEQLMREVRQNGYKTMNNVVLVQHGVTKGKVMIEVEKQDKYDAQVLTFEENTAVDTLVIKESVTTLSNGVKRMKERVFNRRTMEPRGIYYWKVTLPGGSGYIVIFGLT